MEKIWQKKFQEVEILISEALLHPGRVEPLREARTICREMKTYHSAVSWSPHNEARK